MAKKAKDGVDESAPSGAMSDMEAVRRAMNELGYDTETQELHNHILARYGKDLNNNKISAYKSNLRRKAGVAKTRGGRGAGRGAASNAAALRVEDVQTIKELVGRLGLDRVRELIDVFRHA